MIVSSIASPAFHIPTVQVKRAKRVELPEEGTLQKAAKFAKNFFSEVAIAIALNGAVALCFGAFPATMGLFTGALLGSVIGVALSYAIDWYKGGSAIEVLEEQLESVNPYQKLGRASIVATAGCSWPNVAIHENGHALVGRACFKNAQPEVTVHPFKGGVTRINPKTLTRIGEKLGRERSILLFGAGGMLASAIFALVELGIAHRIKEAHPVVSEAMNFHAFSQILGEVLYGITTFAAPKDKLSHDFMRLWQGGGIHPLIPIALLIAVPLLEVAIIKAMEWRRQSRAVERAVRNTAFVKSANAL